MRWALFAAALAWLLVIALFGAVIEWSSRSAARPSPAARAATALARALNNMNSAETHGLMPAWTVVGAKSAHHVMVVDVEAARPEQARDIAVQLVEPLRGRYEEVLVYVRKPGALHDDLAARRIQWTPRGGYVENVYAGVP